MKQLRTQLRKMIRQELINEGFMDDYKQFQEEYKHFNGTLKEKAKALNEKKKHIEAVTSINQKISEVVNILKGLPVSEVLEPVKKSNINKFNRAITIFEDIVENTSGWLTENN